MNRTLLTTYGLLPMYTLLVMVSLGCPDSTTTPRCDEEPTYVYGKETLVISHEDRVYPISLDTGYVDLSSMIKLKVGNWVTLDLVSPTGAVVVYSSDSKHSFKETEHTVLHEVFCCDDSRTKKARTYLRKSYTAPVQAIVIYGKGEFTLKLDSVGVGDEYIWEVDNILF